MNTDQLVSVVAAAVLVVVVSLSAATLQSSMSTTPADAVDLDAEYLPLDEGEVADIDRELRESSGESDESDGVDDPSEADGAGRERNPEGASTGTGDGAGDVVSGADGPSGQAGGGPILPGTTAWQVLVALVALVGLAGGGYRYADRLAALVPGREGGRGPGERAHAAAPVPENGVQRAWIELVERSGIDDPWRRTPRECARAAVAAGADPDAVDRLCRTFEAVTYGGAVATEERVRAADEALRRSRNGTT